MFGFVGGWSGEIGLLFRNHRLWSFESRVFIVIYIVSRPVSVGGQVATKREREREIHIYIYVYTYIHTSIYIYTAMYVCMHAYVYTDAIRHLIPSHSLASCGPPRLLLAPEDFREALQLGSLGLNLLHRLWGVGVWGV